MSEAKTVIDLVKTEPQPVQGKRELKVRLSRMNNTLLKSIVKEKQPIVKERKLRVRLLRMKADLDCGNSKSTQVKEKLEEEPNTPILRPRSDRKVALKSPKVRLSRMNHTLLKSFKKEKPPIEKERKLRVRLLRMKTESDCGSSKSTQVKENVEEKANKSILRPRSDRKVTLKSLKLTRFTFTIANITHTFVLILLLDRS